MIDGKDKVKRMTELIQQFPPITLAEMSSVKLMNRTDTKFVTTLPQLCRLLEMAQGDYFAQEIDGERNMLYDTTYFDTRAYDMFQEHQHGHAGRQKIRFRTYVSSNLQFMEVKTKNNRGRTKKKRIAAEGFNPHTGVDSPFRLHDYDDFIRTYLRYAPERLSEHLENHFDRITLVNKAKTERLTIDTNLCFHNLTTGMDRRMDNLVVIELKRDGLQPSPILPKLLQLRIFPHGFSKYCIGSALTDSTLRRNRIKPRLHSVEKIINNNK